MAGLKAHAFTTGEAGTQARGSGLGKWAEGSGVDTGQWALAEAVNASSQKHVDGQLRFYC